MQRLLVHIEGENLLPEAAEIDILLKRKEELLKRKKERIMEGVLDIEEGRNRN